MDSRQAMEILALYRPGSTDAAEPKMAEALEAAKHDPELAAWFEQHCAVYTAIRGKLKEIPVPADLKRSIIVEQLNRAKVIHLPRAALFRMAAVALVLLAAIFWFMSPKKADTFVRYKDSMARMVQRRVYFRTMMTGDQNQIADYFRTNSAPLSDVLPKSLQKLPAEGGTIVPWENHPISVLCLDAREKVTDEKNDLWVFMAKNADVQKAPDKQRTQFQKIGELMTATWTAGDTVYLLVGRGSEQELQKYLE